MGKHAIGGIVTNNRKDCKMRHENGNCTVAGGFCTSVNDPICEALHNAYECGYRHSALREQEERRWIPVTERLPEPGERVLATDGGFVGELYVNSRGQWQRYNVNDHSLLMALDILWWMPIPEPPKGE